MLLHLLFFGILRERLGSRGESVEMDAGASVSDLLDDLATRYEPFSQGYESIRVAVNRNYVESHFKLSDGDEVAFIPPVAGG